MLYTKYRPEKFEEVVRPNPEIDNILNHLKKGTFGHATILCGSRGIGKTTTARLIAKALNCENFELDVCGVCEACISIKNGSYVDVIEIDGASNRGIEDARDLRESLKFSPLKGKKKVYIIDEVHMLTTPAFNALLKSIEEPPEFVYFILCTTEVEKIPETIRSRCQLFNLKRPTNDQILKKLKYIAENEGINMTDEDLHGIAVYSNGGFRDAETLLTQLMGQETIEKFQDLYSYQSKINYLEFLINNDYKNLLMFHKNLENKGIDIVKWFDSFIGFLRLATHIKLELKGNDEKINSNLENDIYLSLSSITTGDYLDLVTKIIEIYSKIKYSASPELLLDVLILNSLDVSFKKIENRRIARTEKVEKDIKIQNDIQIEEKSVDSNENQEEESSFIELDEELEQSSSLSLEDIKKDWEEVIKISGKENKSVETLLRVVRVVKIEDSVLVFEVDFKFHLERLEINKTKLYIENLLCSVYKNKLFFRVVVENKRSTNGFNMDKKIDEDLTDHNLSLPTDMSQGDILSIFDGAVPGK